MWITHKQAIEMYARFCRARYRTNAAETVRGRANSLAKRGDLEGGEKVWNEVASEIEKLRKREAELH